MELQKPFIAELLHSIPHINISLQLVNSTFNPNSDIYIEVSALNINITFHVSLITIKKLRQEKKKIIIMRLVNKILE